MKIGAAFPGSYLKADDLGTNRPIVIIRTVKMEDVGDDHKPVVYFEGKDKGLVLNKTNASAISEIAGTDETEDWSGVRIQLYQTKVDFQGKRVPAIRVEAAPPVVGPSRISTPVLGAKPQPVTQPDDADVDDVPF